MKITDGRNVMAKEINYYAIVNDFSSRQIVRPACCVG